jgi:septal ring factor EnvC (AmiA/AmiB activator)
MADEPNENPELYFELRHNGQPINPQRGFAVSDGKGQG